MLHPANDKTKSKNRWHFHRKMCVCMYEGNFVNLLQVILCITYLKLQ